jgi:hypothetical protein
MVKDFAVQYFSSSWYDEFLKHFGEDKGLVYRTLFAKAKGKCQLCGATKARSIHPIFTPERKVQKLQRFIVICNDCSRNLRLSELHEDEQSVIKYLSSVLKKTEADMKHFVDNAWAEYVRTKDYTFDFSAFRIFVPDKRLSDVSMTRTKSGYTF